MIGERLEAADVFPGASAFDVHARSPPKLTCAVGAFHHAIAGRNLATLEAGASSRLAWRLTGYGGGAT